MTRSGANLPSLIDTPPVAESGAAPASTGSASSLVKAGRQHFKLVFAIVCLAAAGVIISMTMFGGGPSLAELTRYTACIDAESLEVFPRYEVPSGDVKPYVNPKTGKRTVWPAESCSWTKDGKAKLEPTYILMNEFVGKQGPTICPDCGRKVVFRNPAPPIPLQEEALRAAGRLP